ncbi:class II fructose-bisphosphate aldolase [Thermophilibacter immobilis]|uniref:Class II fructose-bisphosphate aldolase n=1 Tax=Thermophilibacter immobilis TaxID=2779519 RepID=A0A7S7M8R2_9ACTN|nr:class II fructose-bisphosphate aldolase [Thermophilibacter immobilis]QOY60820.1 class II fructose-bisphosphate aldolase [Thermophilibacter immobilis]
MLTNLRDICAIAEQNNMALAAVNSASLEAVRAAIDVAEQTGYPIIIQHAEAHEGVVPLKTIAPAVVALAERSSAQICINLDHCEHLSYAQRALDLGFNGVMFDGSTLPYEQNVEYSRRAAEMCVEYGAGLECELGSMGSREGGERDEGGTAEEAGAIYTDPDQAADFVKGTGLDILACSFGTVHGIYRGEPHLNFDVLEQIRKRIKVPLVMHGGSGVSDDDYRSAIDAGIRKINYYTYGAKYAGEAVRSVIDDRTKQGSDAIVYWHDMTVAAYESFVQTFGHVVKVFANGAAPLA